MVELCRQVAEKMGLNERERRRVELAGVVHDVGNNAVPTAIVNKPGPLTDQEWRVMQTHTIRGQELLEQVGGAFREVGDVVRASHERWDGGGYPDGLSGPSIPLAARIVACCSAYKAMTTERAYRQPVPREAALRELVNHAGTQFDPHVVQTLIAVIRRSVLPALPALRSTDGDGGLDRAGARAS